MASNPAYGVTTKLSSDVPIASNPAYGVTTKLSSDVPMAVTDINAATATPGLTK